MDMPNLKITMIGELLERIRDVKLYNRPGVHAFSITIRVSKGTFIKFFARVKFLVERLSKSNPYYKILHDTQFGNKFIPNKYIRGGEIFSRVYIEHGIGTELSYHDDIGHIKLIINPTLVLASNQPGFSQSTYNYMKIAHDYDTDWTKLSEILDKFFEKWEIPECRHQESTFYRIDTCMDIDMADLDISKYIHYFRLVPKNALVYKDIHFEPDEASKHLMICNDRRAFSVYDKVYEQFENHNVIYQGNIMRLKYHILNPRSNDIINNLHNVFHINCRSVIDIMDALTTLSPVILPGAFDSVFPSGDFIQRDYALHYLMDAPDYKTAHINKIIKGNDAMIGSETYEEVERRCKEVSRDQSNTYYRLRHTREICNIAPLWIDEDEDISNSMIASLPHLIGYVISKDEWTYNRIKSLWNMCKYL